MASRPEHARIGVERDHRRGDQRPEGGDLVEIAAHWAARACLGDLRLQRLDLRVEPLDFGGQYRRRFTGGLWKTFLPSARASRSLIRRMPLAAIRPNSRRWPRKAFTAHGHAA